MSKNTGSTEDSFDGNRELLQAEFQANGVESVITPAWFDVRLYVDSDARESQFLIDPSGSANDSFDTLTDTRYSIDGVFECTSTAACSV